MATGTTGGEKQAGLAERKELALVSTTSAHALSAQSAMPSSEYCIR